MKFYAFLDLSDLMKVVFCTVFSKQRWHLIVDMVALSFELVYFNIFLSLRNWRSSVSIVYDCGLDVWGLIFDRGR
jgi:hypothetical protein